MTEVDLPIEQVTFVRLSITNPSLLCNVMGEVYAYVCKHKNSTVKEITRAINQGRLSRKVMVTEVSQAVQNLSSRIWLGTMHEDIDYALLRTSRAGKETVVHLASSKPLDKANTRWKSTLQAKKLIARM